MLLAKSYQAVEDIRKNKFLYIAAILIILIGAGAGGGFYSKLPQTDQEYISRTIIWVIQCLRLGEFDYLSMLISTLLTTTVYFILFYICSLHVGGVLLLIATFISKGFATGVMVAGIGGMGNLLTVIVLYIALLIPKALMIMALVKGGVTALNCGCNLFVKRKIIRNFGMRLQMCSANHMVLLKCFAVGVFCCGFETFLSTLLFQIA